MEKVNLLQKFELVNKYWSPRIVGEVNESYVKLAKFSGEFDWHFHEKEDELFLIVKGSLIIRLRDREVFMEEGEFFIVPRGVEHQPVAEKECLVMLIEPKETLNTGNVISDRTVRELGRI